MKEIRDNNNNIDRVVKEILDGNVPHNIQSKAIARFEAVKQRLEQEPSGSKYGWFRLSWAGAGMMGTLLGIFILSMILNQSNLTWAEVENRFQSVSFFSATAYFTDNPNEKPEKIEMWMGNNGKCRLHKEGMIYFGEKGKLIQAIHAQTGQPFEPGRQDEAIEMIRMLGGMENFSLDGILKTFCGKITLSEPLENKELGLSKDMTIFDITNDRTPEWMRIWVLKTSGLPVRMRHWDPRQAESMDVVFDYMIEQPEEAFDPEIYQKTLRSANNGWGNQVYALLKDPGGRAMTPQDVFDDTGYHMPIVKEIGMTDEGVVWVLSTKSSNQAPDGRTIEGFGELTDDLSQEYIFTPLGHRYKDDLALEYYIPYAYRIDYQKPKKLILTATTQPDHQQQVYDVIGTFKFDEWVESNPLPDPLIQGIKIDCLKEVIQEASYNHDWDRFDTLLSMIPGEPEESEDAFYRDNQRLDKLMIMDKKEEAFPLARRLFSIIQNDLEDWEKDYSQEAFRRTKLIEDYILLLCARGEEEEAQKWIRIQKKRLKALTNQGNYDAEAGFLSAMANMLHDRYRWSIDRIIQLLETDIHEERIKQYLSSFIHQKPANEQPAYQPWLKFAQKVFEQYKELEFPETLEIARIDQRFDVSHPTYPIAFPDHPDYVLMLYNGSWDSIARGYALTHGKDHRLVRIGDELKEEKIYLPLVIHENVTHKDRFDWILQHNGVEIIEKPEIHTVWVAKYDNRPLPKWRKVRPADGSHLNRNPIARGGGTSTSITSLLEIFERIANGNQWQNTIDDDPVIILDETGLPTKPGENQTPGSICITYSYAFWDGEDGMQLSKDWFANTFGITFHEEERELIVLEFQKKK